MRWLRAAATEILSNAKNVIDELDMDRVEEMIQMILSARDRKIFVIGMGRSGFVGRAFALRLMNLGFTVYFLGETITPSALEDDLVISISGSGATKIVLTVSETAKEIGARVLAITSRPESPLGKIADRVMVIGGRTKLALEDEYLSRQLLGEREPLTPLGTTFENNCLIFLDAFIVELMNRLGKSEEELRRLHATIE
jgi:6-phospho-3-hexuloisomerase